MIRLLLTPSRNLENARTQRENREVAASIEGEK
jgi:hypothetical protein